MSSDSQPVERQADAPRGAVLCVAGGVDVEALSDAELADRLEVLGRVSSQVSGLMAETSAVLRRRVGDRAAAAAVRERLNVSARQATADVALAAALDESKLSDTMRALRDGDITVGHARVIARVASEQPRESEESLLRTARQVPVDMFARVTRKPPPFDADDAAIRARQHENRWASLIQDPDGSWRLSAYLASNTGKRVSLALQAMIRTLRVHDSRFASCTNPQRRADALVNCISREGRYAREPVTLLAIADYDTVRKELTNFRFDDGHPIPAQDLARICEAKKILPAIFNTDSEPLWLGRSTRSASQSQRVALAARDRGCVICAAPVEKCEPHHITWWSQGGNTDIDNLCLVCERCHHLIHDDHWQLTKDKHDRWTLKPPTQTKTRDGPVHHHKAAA